MLEADAKRLWCPFSNVYVKYQSTGAAGNRAMSKSGDIQGNESDTRCLGSGCMAWRFETSDNKETMSQNHGYCGLAGKP